MPLGIDELRHDVAALHRFIESIASECVQSDDYPSYLKPSKDFFGYIHSLADSTKLYLTDFVSRLDPALAVNDPQDFYSRTQVIRTLRISWFEFHQLVKPALDSDTLHVPYALVHALTARLQRIPHFQNVNFTVLHSTELNYFQIRAGHVRDFAANIALIVPGAPQFPPDLGIIALPYSQKSSIFLNVALAHEMGHFAFQERSEAAQLSPPVIAAVQNAAGRPLSALDLAWCTDRVLRWCEEIYCDLFALWLIGPAFSFSFIELFAYTRLVPSPSPTGAMLPPIASAAAFFDSHPAPAFRLGEHVRFMKDANIGWWDRIEGGASHYLRLLSDASALPQASFTFVTQYKPGLESVALSAFFQVVGEVSKGVKVTCAGVPTELDLFDTQRPAIEEYLSYGVVPSRLVSDNGATIPCTVALVNAAYLFYLERLDTLINKIRGARSECLECRALWAERVEMWTSKALEDSST